MGKNKMLELVIASVVGLLVGAGGVVGIQHFNKKTDVVVVDEKVATAQIEVQKELIDLDLLIEPCGQDYIKQNGDLLCREMFCRMQQRGIDAQTSQVDCSEISNIANSISIDRWCYDRHKDPAQRSDCIELFFKRK